MEKAAGLLQEQLLYFNPPLLIRKVFVAIELVAKPLLDTYKYFTNKQRWVEIQELFLEEASSLFHISKTPLLENTMHVGLSSLKSVFWQNYHQEQKDQSKIQLGE